MSIGSVESVSYRKSSSHHGCSGCMEGVDVDARELVHGHGNENEVTCLYFWVISDGMLISQGEHSGLAA